MTKIRRNFTLSTRATNLLKFSAKLSNQSESRILEAIIQKQMEDPKKVIKEQLRYHAKHINQLQERLRTIEDLEVHENKNTSQGYHIKGSHLQ